MTNVDDLAPEWLLYHVFTIHLSHCQSSLGRSCPSSCALLPGDIQRLSFSAYSTAAIALPELSRQSDPDHGRSAATCWLPSSNCTEFHCTHYLSLQITVCWYNSTEQILREYFTNAQELHLNLQSQECSEHFCENHFTLWRRVASIWFSVSFTDQLCTNVR